MNRSRPLLVWLALGSGGVTLCGATACNAVLGNEEGHQAANGGSGGAAAEAGNHNSAAGPATDGGAPSGGKSASGGSPSGGAATGGGSPSGGMSGASGTAGAGGGTVSPYCPGTVTACGGNLIGTWVAQSSCLILPSSDPTIPTDCQGGDTYQRYKITGNVTYTDKMWTEDYTQDVLETLDYSSGCIAALHQQTSTFPSPASASNCGMIAANLTSSGASTASCPFMDSGCLCAMTFTATGSTGDSYDHYGNSAYLNSKDDGHPVNYCVQTVNGVTTLTTSQQTTENYTFEHVLTLSSR